MSSVIKKNNFINKCGRSETAQILVFSMFKLTISFYLFSFCSKLRTWLHLSSPMVNNYVMGADTIGPSVSMNRFFNGGIHDIIFLCNAETCIL